MRAIAPIDVRRAEPTPQADSPRHQISQVLLASDVVTVGRWRCPVESPFFPDSGPPTRFLCVFPRSSVWIRHDGARPFVADPTVVTFYNPGQHYSRAPIDARGDRCDWFGFPASVVREALGAHVASARDRDVVAFAFSHGPSDRSTYVAQRLVFQHVRGATTPDVLFVEETMLRVLNRVVALAAQANVVALRGSTRPAPAAALVEATRAVLATSFARPWRLADIARRVGSSPFHLARVFRAQTGSSLHQHRTELRLRAALAELADAPPDLTSLALSLGFSSHSHFAFVFRRAFGLTPSAFRARPVFAERRRASGLAPSV